MKCFCHQQQDAVGTCKSCGRGLCPVCAADLGKGLAGRGRCEGDAKVLIALIDRNIRMSRSTEKLLATGRGVRSGTFAFNVVLGIAFILWGVTDPGRLGFLIMIGACFLVFGAFLFVQSRKVARQVQGATRGDA